MFFNWQCTRGRRILVLKSAGSKTDAMDEKELPSAISSEVAMRWAFKASVGRRADKRRTQAAELSKVLLFSD
jgi:hypothetical protein